ncbi:MAG: hypothetical protein V8R40_08275 [Dysosmobacter sp.]
MGNGEGFVETILPRRNAFVRPAVANIDQMVVVGFRRHSKDRPVSSLTGWLPSPR